MPLLVCPMPGCGSGMNEVVRNGVHIDVCPRCRGVWLDPGEFEKLTAAVGQIEDQYREAYEQYAGHGQPSYPPHAGYPPQGGYPRPGYPPRNPFDTDDDEYYRRTGKKKSKLKKLFDLFD